MIDLHSHILPCLDDGAADTGIALEMARLAVADGIVGVACTPHIVPGVYDNDSTTISTAIDAFRTALEKAQIPLTLYLGADVHLAPDLSQRLASGTVPALNRSRYFLFEPPHHVLPPGLEALVSRLLADGYTPVITHPERLTWLASHYDVVERLNASGCLLQVTAGSLTGAFGRAALHCAERLLDEGRIDVVASDAHGVKTRRPELSHARDLLSRRVGEMEATKMVSTNPAAILADEVVKPAASRGVQGTGSTKRKPENLSGLRRFFGVSA